MAINFQDNPDTFTIDDVRERIEELKGEFIDATDTDPDDYANMSVDDWLFGLSLADAEELHDLIELEEGAGDCDTFVADYHFQEYCEELVRDCYDLRSVPDFVSDNINWEGVADDLRSDYTDFAVYGADYWGR